ncbi:MAG: cupin domain-containing protein [Pseudorhodoplanes sp.]
MTVLSYGNLFAPKALPIEVDLDGWVPVEGSPSMRTWIEHKTDDGKFLTGFWEAMPGSYRVTYAADEFIHLFEGKVALMPDRGLTFTFSAGDSFQIPRGFTGLWKTEERIRKIFTIHFS